MCPYLFRRLTGYTVIYFFLWTIQPKNLICCAANNSSPFASLAPEEKAHRKWHCGCSLPRRCHSVCSRHDCLQLPSCLCAGASWESLYRGNNIQGTNPASASKSHRLSVWIPPVVLVRQIQGITHYFLMTPLNSSAPNNILCQQVSVTAREDVPPFGPPLPNPAVFRKVRDRQHRDECHWIWSSFCPDSIFTLCLLYFKAISKHLSVLLFLSERHFTGNNGHTQISKFSMKAYVHNPHITYKTPGNPWLDSRGVWVAALGRGAT